jgi:hypothetical protein
MARIISQARDEDTTSGGPVRTIIEGQSVPGDTGSSSGSGHAAVASSVGGVRPGMSFIDVPTVVGKNSLGGQIWSDGFETSPVAAPEIEALTPTGDAPLTADEARLAVGMFANGGNGNSPQSPYNSWYPGTFDLRRIVPQSGLVSGSSLGLRDPVPGPVSTVGGFDHYHNSFNRAQLDPTKTPLFGVLFDTPATIITGAAGAVLGNLYGVGAGEPAGVELRAKITWVPRSEAGQSIISTGGEVADYLGLQGLPGFPEAGMLGEAASASGPILREIGSTPLWGPLESGFKNPRYQMGAVRWPFGEEVPNSVVDGASSATRVGNSKPAWLARLDAGNEFNEARSSAYPYNEVYIDSPKGAGYTRLDSYDPVAGEIVSRKFTQLSNVQEQTAFNYINEIPAKYPINGTIANVPSSGSLAGQPLLGQHILEVPVQVNPIPQSVLDAANRAGVLIRDINGSAY